MLEKVLDEENFVTAQSLSHRMLPMYAQLEADEAVAILKKMNSMRGRSANEYPHWKEDMIEVIRLSNLLINVINEKYLTN